MILEFFVYNIETCARSPITHLLRNLSKFGQLVNRHVIQKINTKNFKLFRCGFRFLEVALMRVSEAQDPPTQILCEFGFGSWTILIRIDFANKKKCFANFEELKLISCYRQKEEL